MSRTNDGGHGLLMIAAIGGSVLIRKNLIAKGIDVNTQFGARDYGNALVAAAHHGQTNTLSGEYGSALATAAARGQFENVNVLVEAGADVNQANATAGYGSPLIAAASLGHKNVAERLIKVGANVSLSLDSASFKTALEASQAPISEADVNRIRDYWNEEEFIANETESLKENRAAVGELLREHGA
ncbi:ankyrin repeat domain-containing protein [Aspergillus melleus]|uniref:ankyrin repeat domain-containing protein n=1 Tax=Aspergillus melleus TaxID=138277 RepID=UPI001E8E1103|nr:uncharacterized protein LDX57_000078 [Aspergillus melleus]KAH8422321.1 hypothetical protein LDX57_000078 [Aspergillus melleus]